MKIEFTGSVTGGNVTLSLKKKHRKFFPSYFKIIIDTNKIKERERGERLK